jgi:hypothetical protein
MEYEPSIGTQSVLMPIIVRPSSVILVRPSSVILVRPSVRSYLWYIPTYIRIIHMNVPSSLWYIHMYLCIVPINVPWNGWRTDVRFESSAKMSNTLHPPCPSTADFNGTRYVKWIVPPGQRSATRPRLSSQWPTYLYGRRGGRPVTGQTWLCCLLCRFQSFGYRIRPFPVVCLSSFTVLYRYVSF